MQHSFALAEASELVETSMALSMALSVALSTETISLNLNAPILNAVIKCANEKCRWQHCENSKRAYK